MLKSIDPMLPPNLLWLVASMGPTRIAATALLASPDPAAGNEPFGRSSVPASSRGRICIARPLRASASCRWGQQGYGCFLISKGVIS